MTTFYETLGVDFKASPEEIEKAYIQLAKFFNPKNNAEVDSSLKGYFEDLTLAYKTLVNPVSRTEYDDYIS
jgi:DnaJ-class molecular chaperone